MKSFLRSMILMALGLLYVVCAFGQDTYVTYEALTGELKSISVHPEAQLASYGKSFEGKELWALTLGRKNRPAILVVAGLDGSHQAGTLASVMMIKNILKTDSLMSLLEDKSLIFIPNANPDAMSGFFAPQKYEKSGNGRPTDDDRNGKKGDDACEDLNQDGWITMMRVETVTGDHIVHSDDPRRMVKTVLKQNKPGTHLYITEGIDNNKNNQWNEDPGQGVNIDKNFAFEYPVFSKNAGEYAVSESETRSLMDFIFQNQNIHSILHLGPHNNLTEPEKYNEKLAGQRIIKSWLKQDATVSEKVSDLYNAHTNLKNPPSLPHTPGSFTPTAYYHTGNFSFSTPFWWASAPDEKSADTLQSEKPSGKTKKSSSDGDYESTFYVWADDQKLNDVFVPWTEIKHPDFPDKKVEVGGLKPYIMFNPPARYIDEQVSGHTHFLYQVLNIMPTHEIVEPKIDKISADLFRVTIKTVNKGGLPSYAAINDKFRFTSRLTTEMTLSKNQTLIAGKKIVKGTSLLPNQSEEHSWLISGKGTVTITSGSAKTGTSTLNLTLN